MNICSKDDSVKFLKRIASELKKQGMSGEIVLEFSGSGDDGCSNLTYDDSIVFDAVSARESDIENHMANLVTIDWCNNEGGQGSVTLDIGTGKIFVHEEENYTKFDSSDKEY